MIPVFAIIARSFQSSAQKIWRAGFAIRSNFMTGIWPAYRDAKVKAGLPEAEALARFVVERGARFRNDAHVAIYCFDEAGLGSEINAMRFLYTRRPLLGFYSADASGRRINLTNILRLKLEFPQQVWLATYRTPDDIMTQLGTWLPALHPPTG